jgi:hypothetical protein
LVTLHNIDKLNVSNKAGIMIYAGVVISTEICIIVFKGYTANMAHMNKLVTSDYKLTDIVLAKNRKQAIKKINGFTIS